MNEQTIIAGVIIFLVLLALVRLISEIVMFLLIKDKLLKNE